MISLRPSRFDELGLRRALSDRLVPFLVACMAFLASLGMAGWMGAAVLARHWESGAAATLTVQIPRAADSDSTARPNLVLTKLLATKGIASARLVPAAELNTMLRAWLGTDIESAAIPVPAVIEVKLSGDKIDLAALTARLAEAAPGTILEDHAAWGGRLETLARSLQLCSGFVLLIVGLVTAAVIAVATRSGLAARRDEVMIVYQLGATDGYIVRRFAHRTATLAAIGGAIGGLLALPVVFTLTTLAMPLGGRRVDATTLRDVTGFLPMTLWLLPVILPAAAAAIGYLTTQATMRRWLRLLR